MPSISAVAGVRRTVLSSFARKGEIGQWREATWYGYVRIYVHAGRQSRQGHQRKK